MIRILALIIVCASGCKTLDAFVRRHPVTTVTFAGGAVIGAAGGLIAGAPLGIPVSYVAYRRAWKWPTFWLAVPVGVAGGVALGLPFFIIEAPISALLFTLYPEFKIRAKPAPSPRPSAPILIGPDS